MSLAKRALAECIGTFWLVFGGCGAALLACGTSNGFGIGYVGVALAFGLTVMTMAYAIGHISGCHLNPAVTLGLVAAGRFNNDKGDKDWEGVVAYIVAQCVGGIIAAGCLFVILNQPDFNGQIGQFATNGWSESLVDGHNAFGGTTAGVMSAFLIEAILTCIFLFVIIGSTDKRAPAGFAPIAIGLCLTLIHLISIPVTNTSVNPARSTAMAIFVGNDPVTHVGPLSQLWLFWVAPILGAVIAGLLYFYFFEKKEECCCSGKKDCKCCKKAAKDDDEDDEEEVEDEDDEEDDDEEEEKKPAKKAAAKKSSKKDDDDDDDDEDDDE